MVRTDLSISELIEGYKTGASLSRLADKHNASITAVRDRLLAANVTMRPRVQYFCNETFFDDLTQEKPAYWLGFIFADGCIYAPPGRTTTLSIELKGSDRAHLEQFVTDIDYTGQVRLGSKGCVQLHISGPITQKLMSLHVIPRKSLVMEFPHQYIPLSSMRHFLRGCLDGDGCIYTQHQGPRWHTTTISYCSGSRVFVMGFRDALCSLLPEIRQASVRQTGTSRFVVAWSTHNDIAWITRLLYNNCTVALERKLRLALPLSRRPIQLRIPIF